MDRRSRGAAVEAAAREMLEQAGLKTLASNVRFRGGELDLVMLDGNDVAFVEVRYRRTDQFGGAAASVDAGKRRKLILAAKLYLLQEPLLARLPCRFDVIEAEGEPPRLNWIKAAFRADGH